jgi:hypothetical protein
MLVLLFFLRILESLVVWVCEVKCERNTKIDYYSIFDHLHQLVHNVISRIREKILFLKGGLLDLPGLALNLHPFQHDSGILVAYVLEYLFHADVSAPGWQHMYKKQGSPA